MKPETAERLRQATVLAQQENDLPDYLAVRIFTITDQLSKTGLIPSEIDLLLEQISLYDTYGQTGYLGMGVNHTILEATIKRIERQID